MRAADDFQGLKGEKGDTGRGSTSGIGGLHTSGFPAGFVEGPEGPPGRKVGCVFCTILIHLGHFTPELELISCACHWKRLTVYCKI